jgi:DNA replication and repair protein RecF
MLSIKLGTIELERGERGSPPLLLLDDILSDLDESRRARLMDWVLAYGGQTLITCTEAAAAGSAVVAHAQVFQVTEGKMTLQV